MGNSGPEKEIGRGRWQREGTKKKGVEEKDIQFISETVNQGPLVSRSLVFAYTLACRCADLEVGWRITRAMGLTVAVQGESHDVEERPGDTSSFL